MKTDIIINRLKDLRDKGECVSETLVLEQAIKCVEALDKVKEEVEKTASRYTISRERGAMGQVEWSDWLIKKDEVLQIIDKHLSEVSE